jgi:uncharacterized membrane protein/ribosomal protein S27AE
MPIETNRSLGGIGSILSLVGVVSTIITLIEYGLGNYTQFNASRFGSLIMSGGVGILAFVGFILFFVAMYGFSKDYGERRIFNYLIYGLVGTIIAGAVIGIIWFALTFASIFSNFSNVNPPLSSNIMMQYTAPLTGAIGVATLIWVYFNFKAYNLLGDKSEVPLFRIGAKILLAGAILNIIMGALVAGLTLTGAIDLSTFTLALTPGAIVAYAAQGVFAIAFFRIKTPLTNTYSTPNNSTYSVQMKYCPKCGTATQMDTIYCTKCGNKL